MSDQYLEAAAKAMTEIIERNFPCGCSGSVKVECSHANRSEGVLFARDVVEAWVGDREPLYRKATLKDMQRFVNYGNPVVEFGMVRVSVTEGEPCGAWGGCTLPKGHNRGKVDIPANHGGGPT